MLNKTICKKCLDDDSVRVGFTPWNTIDDTAWDDKGVICFCPGSNKFDVIKITDPPPKKCYYMLEQLVVDQPNVK